MSSVSVTKMALPLDADVWGLLQDEATKSGQPAVSLVSHVVGEWVRERHRQRVAQEIAEFAAAHAGSNLDLDQELESAALQNILECRVVEPSARH